MRAARSCFLGSCKENGASERGKRCSVCRRPERDVSGGVRWWSIATLHTLSLSNLQTSAEPAFVTGMTLINLALRTSLVVVDVNSESRLTFHFVVSQVNVCNDPIVPAQTTVHSVPLMYVVYRSSEKYMAKKAGHMARKGHM